MTDTQDICTIWTSETKESFMGNLLCDCQDPMLEKGVN